MIKEDNWYEVKDMKTAEILLDDLIESMQCNPKRFDISKWENQNDWFESTLGYINAINFVRGKANDSARKNT